jgi:hypothetical protein
MKVELAGAAAFACLGLIAGALLRPQPGDFRRDLVEPAGFMGPPAGPLGGADPTGGWGAGGWSGSGPVPDYVVGTDSRQPPPGYVPPLAAWEEEEAKAEAPPPAPEPQAVLSLPDPVSAPAPPPEAPSPSPSAPSPSGPDRPKEGE